MEEDFNSGPVIGSPQKRQFIKNHEEEANKKEIESVAVEEAQNNKDNQVGNNNLDNPNITDEHEAFEEETENIEVLENDAEDQTLKFTDLPEIPLRIIFKFLRGKGKPKDRSNLTLRLVSKSVKEIVDNNVVLVWRIRYKNYLSIQDKYDMFDNSDRDIRIRLLDLAFEEKEVKPFIERYPNRIISYNGYLWPIEHFADTEGLPMPKMERLILTSGISLEAADNFDRTGALTNTLLSNLPNLSFLELRGNALCKIKDGVLPCLKSLNLFDMEMEDFKHLPSLLSSCSSTLEKIEIQATYADFTPLKSHNIELKKLKKVEVVFHKYAYDLTALLSFLPQCLEGLYLVSLRDIQDCSSSPIYHFPKLKTLWLERINVKPLLSVLCGPQKLEKVVLTTVDFTSIKGQRYKVTSIKNLVLYAPSEEDFLFDDFIENILATHEFLVGCANSTENIKINGKVVDHCHLSSGNFVMFKKQYIDGKCHFESSSSVSSETEESDSELFSSADSESSSWETIDTESSGSMLYDLGLADLDSSDEESSDLDSSDEEPPHDCRIM